MNLIRGENGSLINPANLSHIEVKSGSLGNGRVHAVAIMLDGSRLGLHSNVTVEELEDRLIGVGFTIHPQR